MEEDIFARQPAIGTHIQVQEVFMLFYPLTAEFDITFREIWLDVPAEDAPIFYLRKRIVAPITEQPPNHPGDMAVIDMQRALDGIELIIDCNKFLKAERTVPLFTRLVPFCILRMFCEKRVMFKRPGRVFL